MTQIFVTTIPGRNFDLGRALLAASRARGESALRIGAEIVRLNRGKQRLTWQEYFLYGAHRPGLTPEARDEFLGHSVLSRMNMTLTPPGAPLQGLATDKLLTDMVLTRAGIEVAPIRAVVVAVEAIAPYPMLADAAAVRRFLLDTPMPVFGKPTHGARGVGAISIVDRQGETLVLGDGRIVPAQALAEEILRSYPKGYLFQDLMHPHPEVAQLIGPVIGSVRVVTLRIGAEIVPIYAAMKMPGPGQMVDDVASYLNTLCSIDHRTGRIVRGQDARRLGGAVLERNPVSGAVLAGAVLPLWPEVMQQARDVHRTLHRQGVVGADYVITPAGPRVTEVNANPMHALYQKCFARGFWNAEIAPQMIDALASFGHRTATKAIPFP